MPLCAHSGVTKGPLGWTVTASGQMGSFRGMCASSRLKNGLRRHHRPI